MQLNPHTILPVSCVFISLLCGLFVITQNPRAKLNRLFLMICITFAAWFSIYIPCNFDYTDQLLVWWYRVSYCFISFVPITCFTFISTYLKISKNEFWFKVNSLIGLTFCVLSISTDWIIKGAYYYFWHPYPQAGILHPFLILHCFYLSIHSLRIAFRALKDRSISSKERNHVKYMLAAVLTLSFAMVDFIGNYGIPFYEIGYIFVLGYLSISSYAIIRYQLMDIEVVIKSSVVYTVLITLITLLYLLFIYVTEYFCQNIFGYNSLLLSLFSATFLAIIFTPLKNLIQQIVEKNLFKGSYTQIAEENELLRQEVIQTEKLKAIATLASGLAHEIKNPLTVLQTFNEYLPEKHNNPEFLAKHQTIVSTELERINNLIQELLLFAKPSQPKLEAVDPQALITNLLTFIEHKCCKANITIVTAFDNTNPTIEADPSQLKQALLNILLNAVDAMPNGGTLSVSSSINDNFYTINVSDTGVGIKPEDLKRIFDPFFTKKEKGTGLGLSITQGIIRQHGGQLTVESHVGAGTTFKIKLMRNHE